MLHNRLRLAVYVTRKSDLASVRIYAGRAQERHQNLDHDLEPGDQPFECRKVAQVCPLFGNTDKHLSVDAAITADGRLRLGKFEHHHHNGNFEFHGVLGYLYKHVPWPEPE